MKSEKATGKTGRPKKGERVKDVYRNVRFSAAEDAALEKKVKQFGGTRSDYIRKAALGAKVVSVPSPETIMMIKECLMDLRNFGNNLNQIAYRANIENVKFDEFDLQAAKKECDSFLRLFRNIQNQIMRKYDC